MSSSTLIFSLSLAYSLTHSFSLSTSFSWISTRSLAVQSPAEFFFVRMRSPHSMKKEFLKKWMMGLQVCTSSKKNMTLWERKKAIKLSADIAMASTRNGNTYWSRALIVNASRQHNSKLLIERVFGCPQYDKLIKGVRSIQPLEKMIRSKKILKRSCSRLRRVKRIGGCKTNIGAYCVAKNLVKKRTKILRSLVPGGEMIVDDACLIEEALDYILSLRAQVDVMQSVADACDQSQHK